MEEVKQAMFAIGDDKTPGPDGYSAKFFQESWDIIRDEISKAIIDFFSHGRMLKEVNTNVLCNAPLEVRC
ncbi:hypothetical protein Pint_35908 [Pistacia integerrima]|uniref:Uncharacterized protein n=1 Tax=Pistacia integerrima TaxID=434235 RepID=A0ACC0XZJ4_9ROSI|nr:hypothetical protein Pint_35908 [Pistacia integerrima]